MKTFAKISIACLIAVAAACWFIGAYVVPDANHRAAQAPPAAQAITMAPEAVAAPRPAAAKESDAIQYDPDARALEQRMNQGSVDVEICFDRAMRGLLRMGNRSRKQIMTFAITNCASGYRAEMLKAGASADASDAYLQMTADSVLNSIVQGR